MKHHRIIIPGITGNTSLQKLVLNRQYGEECHNNFFEPDWKYSDDQFDKKIYELTNLIDELSGTGARVHLLGISAGGSMAINALCRRRNKVSSMISICGRLKEGERVWPSLSYAARFSKTFAHSVTECERIIRTLSREDKKKILIFQPWFDEIVPISTMQIEGVKKIRIPCVEHILSSYCTLLFYPLSIQSMHK